MCVCARLYTNTYLYMPFIIIIIVVIKHSVLPAVVSICIWNDKSK